MSNKSNKKNKTCSCPNRKLPSNFICGTCDKEYYYHEEGVTHSQLGPWGAIGPPDYRNHAIVVCPNNFREPAHWPRYDRISLCCTCKTLHCRECLFEINPPVVKRYPNEWTSPQHISICASCLGHMTMKCSYGCVMKSPKTKVCTIRDCDNKVCQDCYSQSNYCLKHLLMGLPLPSLVIRKIIRYV